MTPKRYLRVPTTASPVDALTHGAFVPLLADPNPPESPTRIVFCTGKFALELIARRDETQASVEVVRLEQLYPWPADEIEAVMQRSPGAEIYWAQEEPATGARYFARRRIEEIAGAGPCRWSPAASARPASGSSTVHDTEQRVLRTRRYPSARRPDPGRPRHSRLLGRSPRLRPQPSDRSGVLSHAVAGEEAVDDALDVRAVDGVAQHEVTVERGRRLRRPRTRSRCRLHCARSMAPERIERSPGGARARSRCMRARSSCCTASTTSIRSRHRAPDHRAACASCAARW